MAASIRILSWLALGLGALSLPQGLHAQTAVEEPARAGEPVATAPPAIPPDPAAPPAAPQAGATTAGPAAKDNTTFEGAVGLVLRQGASYTGGADTSLKPTLAGFIRYKRFTLTGAGGFTTKRKDDVERGLAAEITRRGNFRVSLGLRFDPGRKASDSPELAGMGDIRSTLRARLLARWNPEPGWGFAAGVSSDALNRSGGYFGDISVSREWVLGPGQRLIASASLTGAGDRYLQAWHGVTAEQSAASGYPEYKPKEGLRDASFGLTWRVEFAQRWAGFLGATHTELLGPVKRSPLTRKASSQSVGGGLAWRF